MFIQVAGKEARDDRRILKRSGQSFPIGFEADIIENESAAVVVIRLEIHTRPEDPMAAEILLTPGGPGGHFDTLKRLTEQERLCWFFGDDDYQVIHAQQHPFSKDQQIGMESLLMDAAKHDAVIRLTGRYDAQAALSAVVSFYEPRSAVQPSSGNA